MYSENPAPVDTSIPKRTTIHFKAPGVEFSAEGIEEDKVLPTIEYLQQQNNKQALSELEQYRRYDGLIVLAALFVGMFSFVIASTLVRYIPHPSGVIQHVQK